jgi:hypothetical protein
MPCDAIFEEPGIEHFHELIFPEGRGFLAMIFDVFMDDSRDRLGEKVVVSGIFIGDKERWKFLRHEWRKRLDSEGMRYFKTSEYYGLRGEFRKFRSESEYPPPKGREAAKRVFDDLEGVIERAEIVSIGIVIPVQDYKDVRALPEADGVWQESPYFAALNGGFFETVKAIRRLPGTNVVAFVHDDDSQFPEYQRAYHEFREKNPKSAKHMGGFIPLDDERHPPLQAADLAANATCNFAKHWLENRSEATLQRLRKSMYKVGVWDKEYMLEVLKAQNGKRTKRANRSRR